MKIHTPKDKPIATPTRTAAIMNRYDIKMKKSLGQNFLVEPNILERMIEAAAIDGETVAIEIGPGIGALTEYLACNSQQVYAFEIDRRFVGILEETLSPYTNVEVVHQDILTVDFQDPRYDALRSAKRLVVVANLPYYITTPIIMHLIQSDLPFDRLVMMMQKEVAERMTAEVGSKAYSSLTIALDNYLDVELAFVVPKTVFIPKPNVDSAVLTLTRRDRPQVEVDDFKAFETFVQVAFKQRRKTLWNNLRRHYLSDDYTADQLASAFETAGIDSGLRAEAVSLADFACLYDTVTPAHPQA